MADDKAFKESEAKREEGRKAIGQLIIDGLLSPADFRLAACGNYTQGAGGYWQGSGCTHTQSSGDYHQAVAALEETLLR